MNRCERCGANLDPTVLACPYCQMTTRAGVAAQERQSQAAYAQATWMAANQAQAQEVERRRIHGLATQSLVWSIVGTVLFCFPVGIIGIVQGSRARSAAVARSLPIPGAATIGLWLGIASSITSIGLVTWASRDVARDEARTKARIATIEKTVGTKAESPTLDASTACQLAEARALQQGWNDTRGYSLERFECLGKLTQAGDTAELQDFRFHARSGSEEYRTFVCLKRGARWYADRLSTTSCSPTFGSEASPSTKPSAAPRRR